MNMSVACCCCTCVSQFCAENPSGSTSVPCIGTVTITGVTLKSGCFTVGLSDVKFVGTGSVNGTFTLRWYDPGGPSSACSWGATVPNLQLRVYESSDGTCTGDYTDYPIGIRLDKDRDVAPLGWTLVIFAELPDYLYAFSDQISEPDECVVESLSFTNEWEELSNGDGSATVTF